MLLFDTRVRSASTRAKRLTFVLAFLGFAAAATHAGAQYAPPPPAAPAPAAPAAPAAPTPGAAAAPAEAPGAATADPDAVARGLLVFKEGGCRACHGWAGNGVREGENIPAPSIRATLLAPEDIRLTIQCGRPNAMMPYFDARAYNLDERCYGISRFNVGDLRLPPKGRTGFTEQELDDLVAYLMARVVGLPNELTLEQCELFFGAADNSCRAYR